MIEFRLNLCTQCQKCCVADNSEFSHLKGVVFKISLSIIMVNIEYNTHPSTVHTAQAPCVTKRVLQIQGKLWNTPLDNHDFWVRTTYNSET